MDILVGTAESGAHLRKAPRPFPQHFRIGQIHACSDRRSHAAQLITLEYVRRSAALTQTGLARKMGVGQHAVSRLEARSDMLVSTLRRYVESTGGELELRVRLPGRRKPVSLNALG